MAFRSATVTQSRLPADPVEFAQRRRQLRQKRRVRFWQHTWQFLFISGITTGTIWLSSLPAWILRDPSQIEIEGNHLLAKETIQKLVPVAYPQSIFQVQPQKISSELETTAPVRDVTISRTLFPAKLTVQLKEREPVATVTLKGQSGAVDAEGVWMPLKSYPDTMPKPELTLTGIGDRIPQQWTSLYQQIHLSPNKIGKIDWQDPTNLILTTEDLGVVHCGTYTRENFARQLKTLDRLRSLRRHLNLKDVIYINLSDPETPWLQMTGPARVKLATDKVQ